MLYSEFIENTGCKENDHNYKVYRDLEVLYMNSDISKAEIYEYGKKLVDNSKTAEEIEFENGIKAQIAELKETYKECMEDYRRYIGWWREDKTDRDWKNWAEEKKSRAKRIKAEINGLKMVLGI